MAARRASSSVARLRAFRIFHSLYTTWLIVESQWDGNAAAENCCFCATLNASLLLLLLVGTRALPFRTVAEGTCTRVFDHSMNLLQNILKIRWKNLLASIYWFEVVHWLRICLKLCIFLHWTFISALLFGLSNTASSSSPILLLLLFVFGIDGIHDVDLMGIFYFYIE